MAYRPSLLRFPPDQYAALARFARMRNKPVAAVVREAVAHYMASPPDKPAPLGEALFDKLIGTIDLGLGDASVNLDHYLYGSPKKVETHASVRRRKRPRRAAR